MNARKIVPDEVVFKLIEEGHSNAEICQQTGIASRTARHKRERYNKSRKIPIRNPHALQTGVRAPKLAEYKEADEGVYPGVQEYDYDEVSDDSANFRAKIAVPVGTDFRGQNLISNVEELLVETSVDLDTWEPHNIKVKSYQGYYKALVYKDAADCKRTEAGLVQMYSVSCSLRRRRGVNPERIKEALQELWGEGPSYPAEVRPDYGKDGLLLELGLFDPHLGKLCWKEETGQDMDVDMCINRVETAVADILARTAHMPIERILLPIGNDFFHCDSPKNSTYNDTHLDVDTRFHKFYLKGLRMMIRMIEQLRTIAPVDIICIPGNHDTQSSWHLAVALSCQFHNCEDVTVDTNPSHLKYFWWGQVLLGFVHGDMIPKKRRNGGLCQIMQAEQREAWGKTWFHEWHTGHVHNMSAEEFPGLRIRTLSALTATDAWHHNSGWVGALQAAEAFVYHPERGLIDHPIHALIPNKEANNFLIKRHATNENQGSALTKR